MGKKRKAFIEALKMYGDGRYHYYDGKSGGIGCSDYIKISLRKAGIISANESFHAAFGYVGVLADTTRFERIPWDPANLQEADILWSNMHHTSAWDGNTGVYEAAPESTHGICENGTTGVGHWPKHTYYNCGTGTNDWTCIYRIIEEDETADNRTKNISTLASFLPDIKYGSDGPFVKALQIILKRYGWYGDVVDGHAGPNTLKGIKLMETALGTTVDGCVDKNDWPKLLMNL